MDRLRFNAFSMNCVSHIHHGLWTRPRHAPARVREPRPLGRAGPACSSAAGSTRCSWPTSSASTTRYRGGRDTAVVEGLQIPVNDPSLLIPAMAHATEHLGFAFTSSVLQDPPLRLRPPALHARPPERRPRGLEHRHLVPAERRPQPRLRRPAPARRALRAGRRVPGGRATSCWEGSWEDDAVLARPRAAASTPTRPRSTTSTTSGASTTSSAPTCPSPRRSARRCCSRPAPPSAGRDFAAAPRRGRVHRGAQRRGGAAAQIAGTCSPRRRARPRARTTCCSSRA